MGRMLLFSSDCHAGLRTDEYPEYFEEKYQDELASYLEARSDGRIRRKVASNSKVVNEVQVDTGPRAIYATQLDKRIPALDEDGFAGEILFPDGGARSNRIPFCDGFGGIGDFPNELHAAALRAYNRWLGEGIAPGRQVGLALIPLYDPDYATEQVKAARGLGLGGIMPVWDGTDPAFPQLYDKCFDPMWSACEDGGLPVNFHAGTGVPERMYAPIRSTPEGEAIRRTENYFWTRRQLWHFIYGGVFERHPNLRVGFVEVFSDWIPRTLEYMDWDWHRRDVDSFRAICPRPPSEYWARQCFASASPISLLEAQQYDEFPSGTLTYGTDFPHPGSPFGMSNEYLQATIGLAGIDEASARAILGESIVEIFGLDHTELSKLADEIGPTVEEVLKVPSTDPTTGIGASVIGKTQRPLGNL